MASQKITRFVPLRVHPLEIRRLGSWNTLPRRRPVIFFFPVVSSHDICLCLQWECTKYQWIFILHAACYLWVPETNNNFFRKFKYNLLIKTINFEDDFPVHYMLHYLAAYFGYEWGVRWQCLHAIITLLLLTEITLYWKTWKSYLFNPSKKLSYCGETFPNGCTKI